MQFRKAQRSGMILCNKCGLKEQRKVHKERQMQNCGSERTTSSDASCLSSVKAVSGASLTTFNHGKQCFICHTEVSPLWRSIDGKDACNACGLRNKRLRDRKDKLQAQARTLSLETRPPHIRPYSCLHCVKLFWVLLRHHLNTGITRATSQTTGSPVQA